MTYALTDAATRLADTLARENTALDALDLSGAIALLPEKRRALAALTDAQAIGPMPDQRPAMETAVRRLQDMAAENRRLLRRALTVQNRVIDVIAGTLPRDEPAGRYAAPGARARSARPAAWSLVARA
jgi:hypothetical protein